MRRERAARLVATDRSRSQDGIGRAEIVSATGRGRRDDDSGIGPIVTGVPRSLVRASTVSVTPMGARHRRLERNGNSEEGHGDTKHAALILEPFRRLVDKRSDTTRPC